MDNSTKQSHYENIATNYVGFWTNEKGTPYHKWKLDLVIKLLNLQTTDRLCDIGGGPGIFTKELITSANLEKEVTIVEPSKVFAQQAAKLEQIIILQEDATSFIKNYKGPLFDKILLKEVVHHFSEETLVSIFAGLHRFLTPHGQLLILTRPQDASHFPFFGKALEEWAKHQLPAKIYEEALQKAGFSTIKLSTESYPFQIPRAVWFQLLKQRFFSNLAPFSDAEIIDGIQEIDKKYPLQEPLVFSDKSTFISAKY